jgi:hypothetical protein
VSLGYSPDGKRRRRTVRGRTKTEVRDKLRDLREDIASGVLAALDSGTEQRIFPTDKVRMWRGLR